MEYDFESNRKIAESIAISPWNGRHWIIFFTVSVSFLMWGVALSIAPLITTWYFVPASAYYLIIGAAPAGLLAGNLIMGVISDRTGRKRSYLITLILTVAGLAGIGITYNYIAIIVFVFIAEFGLGGDETVSLSLMAEHFPSRYRGPAMVESSNMANIGITLMAGIFLLLSNSIFIQKIALVCIAIIGGSISMLARYRIRESLLWENRKNIHPAQLNIKNATKFIALSLMGIAIIVGFAFSDLVLGPLHFPRYTDLIIFFSVLAESISGVAGGFIMGRSDRKALSIIGFSGLLGSWMVLLLFFNDVISNLYLLLAMLAVSSVFGEIAWASRELLEPENFTSRYRGRGVGGVRLTGYTLYIAFIFILANATVGLYAWFILIVYLAGFAGGVVYLIYGHETNNSHVI
jgi:hypothetical protein